MIALVLLNLAFVWITDSADFRGLVVLAGLTVLSPVLQPLVRRAWYRAIWNVAVIGIFASLVHHVSKVGAEYLLEDGLLLAGLCQVHLLNNLADEQKPDLLFFNSFLVAVVTSFLCFDSEYLVIFVGYSVVLVTSLEILAFEQAGATLHCPKRRAA